MAQVVKHTAIAFTSDGKVIVKMIDAFRKANHRVHEMVHAIAISCVMHAIEHGNVTPANDFVLSFDMSGKQGANGWRVNHLREWFEKVGPFTYTVDKTAGTKGFKLNKEKRKEMVLEGLPMAFEKLAKTPTFWDMKREPEYKGLDLNAKIIALVREANATLNDAEKMASGKVKIDTVKLVKLAELVNMGEPLAA